MKVLWIGMSVALAALIVGLIAWLGAMPPDHDSEGRMALPLEPSSTNVPLYIGVVPEQDIFSLRKRYQPLTEYLSGKLGRPVEVVTVNTYHAILQDFEERKVDVAFMGSLVAAMVMDRQHAQVLVKPEKEKGICTYHGVIFVKADSPVKRVEDLGGLSIAMVRTTLAAHLFPTWRIRQAGLLDGGNAPRTVFVGTHDDVIRETLDGRVDAGAVMNLRLDAYEAAHPDVRFRRLAESGEVPHDSLVIRADVAATVGPELRNAMLGMDKDPDGAKALAAFGAVRFVPCGVEEFGVIYDLLDGLGPHWDQLGIEGPPPKRPHPAAKP